MSKNKQINISKDIMSEIKKGHIKMKPKWHFVIGSLSMVIGLAGLLIVIVFLISLIVFFLRTHGPMNAWRLSRMMSDFPWWAILVSTGGIWLGVISLKKFDFSYKKNFVLLFIGIILAVVLAGWSINYLAVDSIWMKQRPIKQFYQRYDGGEELRGPRWRIFQEDGSYNRDERRKHNQIFQ